MMMESLIKGSDATVVSIVPPSRAKWTYSGKKRYVYPDASSSIGYAKATQL